MYRTLVADDDFLVRSYLKTLDSWEKAGYEIVDDAEDGEEAYGFLQKEKIDVSAVTPHKLYYNIVPLYRNDVSAYVPLASSLLPFPEPIDDLHIKSVR